MKQINDFKIFVVINLGWLGDTLLTGKLCSDIKINYPNSKIVFVASKPFEEVAKGLPDVDEVFGYDKKNFHKGILGVWKFAKNFPYSQKTDCAFVVHSHERSILLSWLIGAKIRISAPLKNSPLNFLITNKIKYTEHMIRNTYKADFNASYLSVLTGKKTNSTMKFSYPNKYDLHVQNELAKENLCGKKIIGICPLAKDNWRSLSPEIVAKFIEICESNSVKTMIVGAGKASDFVAKIKTLTNVQFLDLTNKTTIFELAAFINSCCVFLSVDTGPMHISYSLGQKTVCVFFNKDMIEEWGPKSFNNAKILCNVDEEITPAKLFQECEKFL